MTTATRLKQQGIQQALDFANKTDANFSENAFKHLLKFLSENPEREFMAETVRASFPDSEKFNGRAWGAIITRAFKKGFIERVGYGQVENEKAHKANASVWRKRKVF